MCLQCFDTVGWVAGRAPGLSKAEWWGAGVVICLQRGTDLHMAQLMPLPLTICCFSKIHIGFTFLVLAHLGSPGKRAVKRARTRVCVNCGPYCNCNRGISVASPTERLGVQSHRTTCVSWHLQFRTEGFCWCKVLLPACHC